MVVQQFLKQATTNVLNVSNAYFEMIYRQNTEQNSSKYGFRFPNKTLGNPNLDRYLVYAHPVHVCDYATDYLFEYRV